MSVAGLISFYLDARITLGTVSLDTQAVTDL
jgi:hypothetical protein